MIGKLYGTVDEIEGTSVLVKTADGVCYNVLVSASHANNLTIEQSVVFYIYTHVREDELRLFGFITKEEQKVFHMLIAISGIGPKSGMTILGYNKLEKLMTAVRAQDYQYFAGIPGIGKKTAQKILLELSAKFDVEFKLPKVTFTEDDKTLIEALVSLGFTRPEAFTVMDKISPDKSIEEKITEALHLLNNKK
ncbi:MAG: Holliday junction branch migration protein RuvA [Patescibacteria group bacterium]|jgi:Holliday junction DNA helicase RuvA